MTEVSSGAANVCFQVMTDVFADVLVGGRWPRLSSSLFWMSNLLILFGNIAKASQPMPTQHIIELCIVAKRHLSEQMLDTLFRLIAERFPTHRMAEHKSLAALWRVFFYLLRPRHPFIMRTAHYRLFAHPRKGTLTYAVIRRGHWEPTETLHFLDLLKPGALVIDAGANFGHYALTAANVVGREGLVIAFEPHPETFSLLDENRKLLPWNNLRAVQAGLGSEDATLAIHTDTANPGGHSFYAWNLRDTDCSSNWVKVYALDSYLAEHIHGRAVNVIKIDVQGFEMEVLRGATRTIERDRPAIFCEITPDALQRAGSGLDEILGFFRSRGYRGEIVSNDSGKTKPLDYSELSEFFSRSGAEYHDVLFRPP